MSYLEKLIMLMVKVHKTIKSNINAYLDYLYTGYKYKCKCKSYTCTLFILVSIYVKHARYKLK